MCTQGNLLLVFTVILITLNNTRRCFYMYMYLSKTVDSFWPVNVLGFDSVWLLSALDIHCTLASISTFWLILTLDVVGGFILISSSLFFFFLSHEEVLSFFMYFDKYTTCTIYTCRCFLGIICLFKRYAVMLADSAMRNHDKCITEMQHDTVHAFYETLKILFHYHHHPLCP